MIGSRILFFLVLVSLSVSETTTSTKTQLTPYDDEVPAILIGDWNIRVVAGKDVNIPAQFSSKTLSFRYCNPHTYNFTIQRNKMTLILAKSNNVNCRMVLSQQTLRQTIKNVASWAIYPNILKLFDSDGNNIISMNKSVVAPPPSIAGNWSVMRIKNRWVSFSIFISNDTISYTYCNAKQKKYTLNDTRISIEADTSNNKSCLNLMPEENLVDSAFNNAKSYAIKDLSLTLFDSSDNQLVVLQHAQMTIVGNYTIISLDEQPIPSNISVEITNDYIFFVYCNMKEFSYNRNGNNLYLEYQSTTKMSCGDMRPSQSEITAAFEYASSFSIDRTSLSIYDKKRKLRLVLVRNL